MKEKNKGRICPVCKERYFAFPAITRKDNKKEICPMCGVREALFFLSTEDLKKVMEGVKEQEQQWREILKV